MTHQVDVARGRDIVARWCNLAEQRLEHLTELFETGRWRRFHTEVAFLENIREAKAAVDLWRQLVTREASLDNSAVDLSWLSRPRSTLPQGDRFRERVQLHQPQPEPMPAPAPAEPSSRDIPADVLAFLESQIIASDDAPSAPDAPAADAAQVAEDAPVADDTPAAADAFPMLDLAAMQARYPLLRNAM